MLRQLTPASRLLMAAAACAAFAGCGSLDSVSTRIATSITPYRVEVVQGNFVSREQVEVLRPGMTRQQVREVLGTPLLISVFHADRWDYVFTLKRKDVTPQERKLAVFFKNGVLERFEGDAMPSEAEFVATLDKKGAAPKVPVLQASGADLAKFQGAPSGAAAGPIPEPPPPALSYPPLESPAR